MSGRDARNLASRPRISSQVRRPPFPEVNDPGCITRPSSPVTRRGRLVAHASIERAAAQVRGGEMIRSVVRDDRADLVWLRRRRKSANLFRRQLARAPLAGRLVKIWSAWHPLASARSTARGSPPAIDKCAPRRGINKCYPWIPCARSFRSLYSRSRCRRCSRCSSMAGDSTVIASSPNARSTCCPTRSVPSSRSSRRPSSSTDRLPDTYRTVLRRGAAAVPRNGAYGPFTFKPARTTTRKR